MLLFKNNKSGSERTRALFGQKEKILLVNIIFERGVSRLERDLNE